MSYSRWDTKSCWYVWWQDHNNCDELAFWYSPLDPNKSNSDVIAFSFNEITENTEGVLGKLQKHTNCSAKNLQKARGYIKEFVKDVKAEKQGTKP